LDFSLALDQNAIFQGKDLATKITLSRLDPQYENSQAIVKYIILDDQGQQQSSALSDAMLHAGEVLSKNINVPTYFKSGQYSIRAEIIIGQYDVSRVNNFSVLPLPLVNLGGGIVATYPEILSQIGTISLWLLICLLIWLLLFSREYWLYLHAIRHITENNLAKTGLFGKPKGKGVSR